MIIEKINQPPIPPLLLYHIHTMTLAAIIIATADTDATEDPSSNTTDGSRPRPAVAWAQQEFAGWLAHAIQLRQSRTSQTFVRRVVSSLVHTKRMCGRWLKVSHFYRVRCPSRVSHLAGNCCIGWDVYISFFIVFIVEWERDSNM